MPVTASLRAANPESRGNKARARPLGRPRRNSRVAARPAGGRTGRRRRRRRGPSGSSRHFIAPCSALRGQSSLLVARHVCEAGNARFDAGDEASIVETLAEAGGDGIARHLGAGSQTTTFHFTTASCAATRSYRATFGCSHGMQESTDLRCLVWTEERCSTNLLASRGNRAKPIDLTQLVVKKGHRAGVFCTLGQRGLVNERN